jgi:hypothetical protein
MRLFFLPACLSFTDWAADNSKDVKPPTETNSARSKPAPFKKRSPPAHLECGGLPPLCSPPREFAKIKSDGKARCRAEARRYERLGEENDFAGGAAR